MKKLYKDKHTKIICGVCSGIAKYFDIDATLIRLAVVVLSLFSLGVTGIILYIIAAIIIPEEPDFEQV